MALFCVLCACLIFVSCFAHEISHDFAGGGSTHDYTFDHEAFLGKEEMAEFGQLTEAQSKARLAKMIPTIDADGNGTVTMEELREHVRKIQLSVVQNDINRSWSYFRLNDGVLTWKVYLKTTYGSEEPNLAKLPEGYEKMYQRDSRAWKFADVDQDTNLTKEEYTCLMHPEECAHMQEFVVENTFRNMDKNGDGFIVFDEYIGDVHNVQEALDAKEEPNWLAYERGIFKNVRDTDGDGKLNMQEMKKWVLPENYDTAEAEARHLVAMADDDKDGKLTAKEILDNYSKFVNSQATNYGDQLRKHDPSEL